MFGSYKYAGGPIFAKGFSSSSYNASGSIYSILDVNKKYKSTGSQILSQYTNDSAAQAAGQKYGVGLSSFYTAQAKKQVSLPDAIKQPGYSGGTDQGTVPDLIVAEKAVAAISDDEALPPAPDVTGKTTEDAIAAWEAYGVAERAAIKRNNSRAERRYLLEKKPTEAPKAKAAEAEARAKARAEGESGTGSESETELSSEGPPEDTELVSEEGKLKPALLDISEKLGQDKFQKLSPAAARSPLNRARFILTAGIVGSSARVELLKNKTKPRLNIVVKSEEAKQDRMTNFKGIIKSAAGKELKEEDPNTYALYKYLARGTPFVVEGKDSRFSRKPPAAKAAAKAAAAAPTRAFPLADYEVLSGKTGAEANKAVAKSSASAAVDTLLKGGGGSK
jgi:hypothetical protein